MDLLECVLTRRSVRKFTDKPIADETLKKVILAGMYAPTACNFQAMKYIVITKDKIKESLYEAGGSRVIANSTVGVMVCYRNDIYVSGRKYFDYIQSGAASIQNMLLTAHDLGLGGCWICDLPEIADLNAMLHIPDNYSALAYIALGYPDKDNENTLEEKLYHYGDVLSFKEHKRKYSIDQICTYNEFISVANDSTFTKYPKKKSV